MMTSVAASCSSRSRRQLQQMRRGSVRNLFDSAEERLARQMESLKQKSSRHLVGESSSVPSSLRSSTTSSQAKPDDSETSAQEDRVPSLDRRQMFAMSRFGGLGAIAEPEVEQQSESTLCTKNQRKCRRSPLKRRESSSVRSNTSSYSSLRDLSGIAGLPPLAGLPDLTPSSDLGDESEFSLGEELESFRSVLSETIAQLDRSEHASEDAIGIYFRSRRHLVNKNNNSSLRASARTPLGAVAPKAPPEAKRKRRGTDHKHAIGKRLNEKTAGDALFRIDPRDKEIITGRAPVARLSIRLHVGKMLKKIKNQQ